MSEWVESIMHTETLITLRLKSKKSIDFSLSDRFEKDDLCLPFTIKDRNQGIITYSIEGYLSLDSFLKQYIFKKEEIYIFLDTLFTSVLAVNRNKPVLYDPEYIFVSQYGEKFGFLGLPIRVDDWITQKKMTKEWLEYLIQTLHVDSSYEVIGFLYSFLSCDEFSVPNLILSLKALRLKYYPKKIFRFHSKNTFKLDNPIFEKETQYILQPVNDILKEEQTQVLGCVETLNAYLEKDGERYPLCSEIMYIGRSMACDIRLEELDVSLKHAKLSCVKDRWYIQDLKSKNKTYLDEKLVQRKMRLKDGMHLRLANTELIFHE